MTSSSSFEKQPISCRHAFQKYFLRCKIIITIFYLSIVSSYTLQRISTYVCICILLHWPPRNALKFGEPFEQVSKFCDVHYMYQWCNDVLLYRVYIRTKQNLAGPLNRWTFLHIHKRRVGETCTWRRKIIWFEGLLSHFKITHKGNLQHITCIYVYIEQYSRCYIKSRFHY